MIGTVHLDSAAEKKLEKVLTNKIASAISVEISRFSVNFRKQNQKKWLTKFNNLKNLLPHEKRNHFRLVLLEQQLKMPFEWRVASDTAFRKNIPCLAIDSGKLAKKELPLWDRELLSIKNLLLITEECNINFNHYFNDHYELAKKILLKKQEIDYEYHPLKWLGDHFWQEREQLLAKRIKKVASSCSPLLHIGGWAHLAVDLPWKTAASMLQNFILKRILVTGNSIYFIDPI